MQEGNEDQVMIEDIGEMIDLLVKDIVMKIMIEEDHHQKMKI